ncbi:MAG: DNA polymerase III subunit delta' [Peptococcaceae bacterium]|nr:DNA polymerase III subunit delta' [Peptococcaceae bacterium]
MILFKDIIGQGETIRTLRGAIEAQRVAHAHIFSGPKGVGKMTTALAFARALLCLSPIEFDGCGKCNNCQRVELGSHPELMIIKPKGTSVKLLQIRDMSSGLQFGPKEGTWAVRIIDDADTMTPEAANSLLRILEEPLPGVVFILLTSRPQAVLPTVLSRCQQQHFQSLSRQQLIKLLEASNNYLPKDILKVSFLAGGSPGVAQALLEKDLLIRDQAISLTGSLAVASINEVLFLAEEYSSTKEGLLLISDMMILWFRDILLYNETGNASLLVNNDKSEEIKALTEFYSAGWLMTNIETLERAKSSLAASANIQLAAESLFLMLAGFDSVNNWQRG